MAYIGMLSSKACIIDFINKSYLYHTICKVLILNSDYIRGGQ